MSVSPVPTSDSKAEVVCACVTGMANSEVCRSGSAAMRMISAGASQPGDHRPRRDRGDLGLNRLGRCRSTRSSFD